VSTLGDNWARFAALSTTHNPESELLSDRLPSFDREIEINIKFEVIWDIFPIWKNYHKMI
jgi:hypothetical protein